MERFSSKLSEMPDSELRAKLINLSEERLIRLKRRLEEKEKKRKRKSKKKTGEEGEGTAPKRNKRNMKRLDKKVDDMKNMTQEERKRIFKEMKEKLAQED